MKNDRIPAQVLSAVVIPQVDENLRNAYGLAENQTSCAVFTATFDDFIFLALDDATKKANVTASYIHSFYAGGPNASSKLQGEGIGILAGERVPEILAGVAAVLEDERSEMVCAISRNEDDSITSLTCTVARTGTLFEKFFGIPAGSSIAYLAGPPVESYFAVDSAIKISGTRLGMYFAPAETNCGGAILIGTQSQCAEAAKAYAEGIQWIADHPKCTNEGRR